MAKPIQPTPTLHGEDAEKLLKDLAKVQPLSDEEWRKRVEKAKKNIEEMMRKKIMALSSKGSG